MDQSQPILRDLTPLVSAQVFLRRRRPTLMHYNDDWLAFDGVAYVELEDATVRSEVYDFLHPSLEAGNPPKPFCPDRKRVTDVMDALKGAAHRPRDTFAPPCWLEGTGPMPLETIACQNGLLHLPTGELHPLTWRFFTRNALGFAYQPDAPPPRRWLQFLDEVWPGEGDVVAVLQEIFG